MSYQVVVASSRGDDATMAKSLIITLEGLALNWYTRLPPLSIESWNGLRDKFLLNFQGYRPDTDALAELSLCKQQEKETLREYYKKFLTLKSQLPSVDEHIAIHYAISGLRVGVLYSHCIRDPPKNLQELYQLFEKYARSEELHQREIESQRKPKDTPQSSRTWVKPAQSDSGRENRNQQQVHTIANQHPVGDTVRRQEYPSQQNHDNNMRGRGRGWA
jgi:TFIIF-interacting CTD phosphatase-like protein